MEINKVQCMNQHWFNADKYSVCPHCGAKKVLEDAAFAGVNVPEEAITQERSKKKGWFRRSDKRKAEAEEQDAFSGSADKTGSRMQNIASIRHSANTSLGEEINPEILEDSQLPQTEVLIDPGININMESSMTNGVAEPLIQKSQMQHMPTGKDIDDIKTVSIYANVMGEEPVTGWIVGVKGEYIGCSFALKAGVNIISRDAGAYICLKKDLQVSRVKHASIIYEPKKKLFYIGEGENSMTYCNDELVCGKQELNAYDVIEIGSGKYMFMPFCGERFDWDKEIQ